MEGKTGVPGTDSIEVLKRLAQRLADNTGFIAHVLNMYKQHECVNDLLLLDRLGISPVDIIRLALCRRPDSESSDFAAHVRQIAAFAHCDALELSKLLRYVSVLERLATLPSQPDKALERQTRTQLGGVLSAARDRESGYSEDALAKSADATENEIAPSSKEDSDVA